ncbi:allantoate amidohydrolase [Metabacillus rhizolycopersici]|uniref:Allantoate amidohydrolase n=1 Tax=Metabacillus rhizolycopersici TaxID=2875709 RepID=A0ABS7UTK1_9BACI|nr:allantoate amidohydrolase [Metabacillus rhizolycopersici]MBZ5751628.1 allantoate amidohydrolase [Metabacillus rhizolycopersici]
MINAHRILERIELLATCSKLSKGVTRLSFTKESMDAENLVIDWMQQAGLSVRKDEMNNIIGRYEGRDPDAPVLMIGSHLDSVIDAGKFDGILGVIAAIEVVQALINSKVVSEFPIEVISFCDEEGTRFHTTFLGSKAIAGTLKEEDLQMQDDAGISIASALNDVGIDPTNFRAATRSKKDLLGYLELHIEQGPVLQEKQLPCGIVSGFASASRHILHVEGRAEHAGTVPLTSRKDALVGAAEAILFIEKNAKRNNGLMATVGKLVVEPGASNVIPGFVSFTLDVRDIIESRKLRFLQEVFEKIQEICHDRKLVFQYERILEIPSVMCSKRYVALLEEVFKENDIPALEMISGAGHDAIAMSDITEVGMIFVRCKDGISHHPDEHVSLEDIEMGTRLLLESVLKIVMNEGV